MHAAWAKKWQEQIDFISKQLRLERKSETTFTEANNAMREHYEVYSHKLPPLPQEPVLSYFYTPSNTQHDRELAFITLSMIAVSSVLQWLES